MLDEAASGTDASNPNALTKTDSIDEVCVRDVYIIKYMYNNITSLHACVRVSLGNESENRNGARRTADSTLDVQRSRGQEEAPPVLLLAGPAEFLEIPHLANGGAPLDEEPFVQAPTRLEWWRPG